MKQERKREREEKGNTDMVACCFIEVNMWIKATKDFTKIVSAAVNLFQKKSSFGPSVTLAFIRLLTKVFCHFMLYFIVLSKVLACDTSLGFPLTYAHSLSSSLCDASIVVRRCSIRYLLLRLSVP